MKPIVNDPNVPTPMVRLSPSAPETRGVPKEDPLTLEELISHLLNLRDRSNPNTKTNVMGIGVRDESWVGRHIHLTVR